MYRSIIFYLNEKRKHNPNFRLNNIYGQMDNAKGNKCWTMYAGISALVAYGVCTKFKLSFGLANHNHMDIDSTIGIYIITYAVFLCSV